MVGMPQSHRLSKPAGVATPIARLLSMVLLLTIGGTSDAWSDELALPDQPPAEASRIVVLNGDRLTIADIVDIAEGRAAIEVSPEGMERIRLARGVSRR